MHLRTLVLAGLCVAAAASLTGALASHDGVGPLEYVAGIALVLLLLAAAVRLVRRGLLRRT
jgi:hypothetical protein